MRNALTLFWPIALAMLAPVAVAAPQDNVLFLIADDLGVDKVAAYGESLAPPPTPNLDALAARGVLFRNAYSNPWCSPTRACIQTGRYSFRTGVGRAVDFFARRPQGILQPAEVTLPEMLDAAGSGYTHAMIGKWHLDTLYTAGVLGPNQQGWSHYSGMLFGFVNYTLWPRTVNGITATSTTYATSQIVDDAIGWIQQQTQPWVCGVSFNAPHSPWTLPPTGLYTRGPQFRDDAIPDVYGAMVEAMDMEIGRLLAALGPQLAQTNVIFIGDNGTPFSATIPPTTTSGWKGSAREGGINVPLIVAGPSIQGTPGRVETALVDAVDLFATIAELCGVGTAAAATGADSISFVPHLMSGGVAPQRAFSYTESFSYNQVMSSGFAAVRDPQFKLIRRYSTRGGVDELYDLVADPLETFNLLAAPMLTPEQSNAYSALQGEIARLRVNIGSLTVYGTVKCAGTNGNPAMVVADTPRLGASYAVGLRNGVGSATVALLAGNSNTSWSGVPLPFDLALLGAGPGCFVFASGELQFPAMTGPAGGATLTIRVPSAPEFLGRTLYHQWFMADPPASPLGLTSSNGARALIGL